MRRRRRRAPPAWWTPARTTGISSTRCGSRCSSSSTCCEPMKRASSWRTPLRGRPHGGRHGRRPCHARSTRRRALRPGELRPGRGIVSPDLPAAHCAHLLGGPRRRALAGKRDRFARRDGPRRLRAGSGPRRAAPASRHAVAPLGRRRLHGQLARGLGGGRPRRAAAPSPSASGRDPRRAARWSSSCCRRRRGPDAMATAGRWLLYAGLILLVGAASTSLLVYGGQPAGRRRNRACVSPSSVRSSGSA